MNDYQKYQSQLGPIPNFLNKYLKLVIVIRLKQISLLCGMQYASKAIYDFFYDISRLDHSLNEAKIIWKLTKNKKLTIAGLFHDIASPVFSHVVDYMNGDYWKQESTEAKTEEILRSSKRLQEYLKMDGLTIEDIIAFKEYSIADLPRPYLCADRVENTISSGFGWTGTINYKKAATIVDALTIEKNEFGQMEIALTDEKAAIYLQETNDEFHRLTHTKEDAYMMFLASNILKETIELELVSYDDLFRLTEPQMVAIIERNSKNQKKLKDMWKEFTTIKTVPDILLPNIKNKLLRPIVNGKRI